MDLILLQPGDQAIFPSDNSWTNGGSLIDEKGISMPTVGGQVLKLKNCIELVSIHQGMKQQVTTDVSNSARTSGRPVITEFTCVKYVDRTSVKLYDYCLRAETIGKRKEQPSYIYVLRNSGDKTYNIITFALRDALISEIQFQSHPDDMPTEQLKLNFSEILWTYNVQLADMTPKGNVIAGWSLAHNRPITQFT
ncbi:Hcp family type VI secretion system effector [Rhodoferax sp.]|uniref:Hcp family type VI secretion system effector n=1 Tax=Rhodoferax sp. TaxID=50421 RepID=UPI0027666FD3|nr:type VI secretion system tube protein Hcp [Rhodoferax sp.]